MPNIYDLLNDADFSTDDIKRVELTDQEKKDTLSYIIRKDNKMKSKHNKKRVAVAAAAAALVLTAGVAVATSKPAQTLADNAKTYFNGNTKNFYSEVVNKTVKDKTGKCEFKMLNVDRQDNYVYLEYQLTFDKDVTDLAKIVRKEGLDEPQRNIFNSAAFKNCNLSINGETSKEETEYDDAVFNKSAVYSVGCSNLSIKKNVLTQRVSIGLEEEKSNYGDDFTVNFDFKNLILGKKTVNCDLSFDYTVKMNKFKNEKLNEKKISTKATDSAGGTINIYSYSTTPSGVLINAHIKEGNKDNTSVIQRMTAYDDLGNKYLLYPWCRDYKNNPTQHCFTVYDGPAIYKTDYKPVLARNAKTLTVHLQEEVCVDGKPTMYNYLAKAFTIRLDDPSAVNGTPSEIELPTISSGDEITPTTAPAQ